MEYPEKETYQRKILQTYQESFGGRVEHFLVRPTPGNVKKAVVEVAGLALSASDGQMLKKGLGLDDTKPLLEQINKKDSDDFKTLSNFLKRKTTDTDHTNLDVIAVLIDFNPRPFSKFKKVWKEETFVNVLKDAKPQSVPMGTYVDETFSVEEIASNKILKTPKIHPLLKWGIGGTLFLVLLFSTYHFAAKEKSTCFAWMGIKYEKVPCNTEFLDQKGIIIHVNNGDVNIENFRQISPNQQTAFYDNAGNPQVWYANNQTGNPEYFNQMGNHPITQTPLKPVPIQLVARYKYVTENNEESETEGNNEEEKLASPKSDILNPTYTNTAINEVAILAFSKEEIDNGLEQVLNEKISEKNKNIAQLFYTTRFTSEQKKSVVMGDFSELPNLENYVDVVLVASSTYTFRKSKLNEQLIVCDVEVTYFQHNTKTKINGFSKSTTAVGSGFSKAEAKQNALNKLVI